MRNTLEAVLFDVDGTLIDTEKIQSDAFLHVLKEHGHHETEVTEHGTIHIPGETTDETWQRLKDRHGLSTELDELASRKRQAALNFLHVDLVPLEGVVELFDSLHTKDVKIAVVSSAKRERLELMVEGLGLRNHIDEIVSADDVAAVKPAPDPYLVALKRLGADPKKSVVIEDAEVGVISAKAAGVKVVAVPNDYTKRMDFSGADLQVTSLVELTFELLDRLVSTEGMT